MIISTLKFDGVVMMMTTTIMSMKESSNHTLDYLSKH